MSQTTEPGSLARDLINRMPELTAAKTQDYAVTNVSLNLPFADRGKSIAELRNTELIDGSHALIVAAGPSIRRNRLIDQIVESKYDGPIICTDSALYSLLAVDIIPDLVVTVDPHPTRMLRWFGDPDLDLSGHQPDDYFTRQEMDSAFYRQAETNAELLRLVGEHGTKIKIALATSTPLAVTKRVIDAGMEIFWWNPMLDDPSVPDSISVELMRLNKFPCINGCGNVGASSWMIADAVLNKSEVGLLGFDFSYYDDTAYLNTQYYTEAVEMFGEENLSEMFIRVFNPHIERWFYTDPAYAWYKQVFLEAANNADCKTVNCTGGGILFGEPIHWMSLKQFADSNR